jgi:hypothetical protein
MLRRLPEPSTPFPDLIVEEAAARVWPSPPMSWRHAPVPDEGTAQPCAVESHSGTQVEGELLIFDVKTQTIGFRSAPERPVMTLPFLRFRRLTLTTPLTPAPRTLGAPVERVPVAAQVRDYRLSLRGKVLMTGRTAGHIAADEGMYLFTPVEEDVSLQRVFVPRTAYSTVWFGPSVEEIAAEQWVATPEDLLAAIERQKDKPVPKLGRALLDLGMLTQGQLKRALDEQYDGRPLGKMLVDSGVLSRHDLQTALAYKMGFPYVDLTRFPIEAEAARLMPLRMSLRAKAIPLMLRDKRLIVAVDNPSRAVKLGLLRAFSGLSLIPVLAQKSQILLALSGATSNDAWAQNVFAHLEFFPTTT